MANSHILNGIEPIEQQQQQQQGENAGEPNIDDLIVSNFLDIKFSDTTEICQKPENDQHKQEFSQPFQMGTNFASAALATKATKLIKILYVLASSIKKLPIQIGGEKNKVDDIIRDLKNLILCYITLVNNTKDNMDLYEASLRSSFEYIKVLYDILSSNDRDRKNIEIVFKCIVDTKELFKLAETLKKDIDDLNKKIQITMENISENKRVIQQRLQFARWFPGVGVVSGCFGGYIAATALVNSSFFKRRGGLVIRGISFSPVNTIIAAAAIGGSTFGVMCHLLNPWKKKYTKQLDDLNTISTYASELNGDNLRFKSDIKIVGVDAWKIVNQLKQIRQTVKSDSKWFTGINRGLFTDLNRSINSVIPSINKINDIDVSKWEKNLARLNNPSIVPVTN